MSGEAYPVTFTERMVLRAPRAEDVDELFALESDPRVWTHFPGGRVTSREGSAANVERRLAGWQEHGLGPWTARDPGDGRLLGIGGCQITGGVRRESQFWNLGYRFRPEEQGRGLATELSRAAMAAASDLLPDVPIVAYLLEHNAASAGVAGKLGLSLRWRGVDAGNPDPSAVRLVYADRELTSEQLPSTRA